ncbi:large ribosomal subunit protein eL42-like [Petaurus breviceps papuanus]|uniref:large ribosomal subunit protein eL42-like n=1 Tax=Petaurus breviceps papuanus TaxID=3040969 RepID=UPI0036DCC8B3
MGCGSILDFIATCLDIREAQLEAQCCPLVNIPKTHRTFCKKCRKYQPHKVTQYKKGKDSLYPQGKRQCYQEQSDYGAQTKPIFQKKAKTAKNILRLECVEPKCRYKRMFAIKRGKHFELGGDKKRTGDRVLSFIVFLLIGKHYSMPFLDFLFSVLERKRLE